MRTPAVIAFLAVTASSSIRGADAVTVSPDVKSIEATLARVATLEADVNQMLANITLPARQSNTTMAGSVAQDDASCMCMHSTPLPWHELKCRGPCTTASQLHVPDDVKTWCIYNCPTANEKAKKFKR